MLTKLGKYEIKRELGRGAMGIVYEGFDPFIERTVAIKTVQKSLIDQSEAQEALSRFRREAQAAGRLTHPNIVSVYEYGEEEDMAFIAMEFIIGKELKSYFDKGEQFQIKDGVHTMLQLLDALDYSHERGVVHRDIKPSNIIITKDYQVKVVDFGIARIESSELTQVGTVLGTPAYMSPEQFRGLVVDRRSDIYSSGVILYQFLTGDRPFTGNPTTLMHKVLCQAPMPPSELNPEVSKALENVVIKAMSKQPEDRFQTAAEFKQALILATDPSAVPAARMVDADATLVVHKNMDATLVISKNTDATVVIPKARQNPQADDNTQTPIINFDLEALSTHIEKRLEEDRQSSSPETNKQVLSQSDQALMLALAPIADPVVEGVSESTPFNGSVREAEGRPGVRQAIAQPVEHQTKAQRLHETLEKVANFLDSFAQHVNKVEPAITRSYNFGRRTVYTNLTCRNAHADKRKQSLFDSALLDYVSLSISLCAPAPLVLSRPRDMLGALKEQLNNLKLRSLDDLEVLGKGAQEDWVQVHLAPDFPMQLQFKGNYGEDCIDVQTSNIEAFGDIGFKLKVEDATPELMDGIGLFLLGSTDQLPAALRRV